MVEYKDLYYPGLYPDENKIIPYSPRKRFGFVSPTLNDKIIELESMKNMNIDQIVELYKDGYVIGSLETSESAERRRTFAFMDVTALPFDNAPSDTLERERKYGFMNPPEKERDSDEEDSVEEIRKKYEEDSVEEIRRKYDFAGKQIGITVGADALLLIGIGVLAYIYLKKK